MSFFSINGIGLIIGPSGQIKSIPLSGGFPPVSDGRLWVNADFASEDWGRDSLFLDVMRTARPWRAQTASEFDDATLRAEMMASADADGYPTVLPAGVIQAGTFVLMEQATESAPVIGGRYRLEWQGSGTVVVNGPNQTTGTNAYGSWIEFDYTPNGTNSVDVRITAITPGNHPRGMRCYMVAHAALIAQGRRVHPAFAAAWGGVKLIRFMLTQRTNVNEQEVWADAPQPTSICRGVSWRELVDVCNELGCDGWFHLPHRATSGYVTQAATVVRDHLNPALKAYVEYSNEWWNSAFGFNCYPYLEALRAGKSYNFAEQAGGRSAEVMQAWSAVFAGQMSRTVRVAGMHTGWQGLEQDFLLAPGWVAEVGGRPVPHTLHDAIAVTGYFNCPASEWPAVLTAAGADYATGRALMIEKIEEDIAAAPFPYFRGVADTLGKDLIMYEGGSHIENPGGLSAPTLANTLINEVNTGSLIYDLYDQMMRTWDAIGDGPFMQFSTTRRPQATGAFGAQHYINDFTQPRYTALMDYNAGTLPTAGTGPITPLPLNLRFVVTGHSIPDAIVRTPLAEAITAMGGTAQKWTATGPHVTAQWRWNNPVTTGTPDNVKALMEAGGAAYDAFLGIEAHGGNYGGRASVQEHITWSDAYGYAVLWHNLAASTGAQTYYANFWRNDPSETFGSDWRAAQDSEIPLWDAIIDHVNANKAAGTPTMRLVPWLQVWCAVYDAIQAGTVTGVTMGAFFSDDVHPDTNAGRWLQLATLLAVVWRRHPDELPAAASSLATISSGLAAQLRPIVWNTCLSTARTGLS